MTSNLKKTVALSLVSLFALGTAATSMAAEGHWGKEHPRRHEVNDRLQNQDKRIDKEVKEGEMSKAEARKLHKDDHQIRQEERDMASQDKGHISKQEQKTLNQQENSVSKQIGK
ncbi:MAG: hypothetical protein JSR19_00155 [Proteobacteria bacterium]|nr:hypothetical protein [Pseudomonadota bacterium]HQR04933.1 hypothetical protein [Rhodocyclaceae bacterium]